MKLRAAFDCDGIILDSDEVFRDHFIYQGYRIIENGKFYYDLDPPVSKGKIDQMVDDCIERRTEDMDPYDGILEIVNRIAKDTGDPLHVVTARNPKFAGVTIAAIKRAVGGAPFFTSFTPGASKLQYLKDFPVFIEDRRRTAIELAEAGKVVICPKRRYNWPMSLPKFDPKRKWTWLEEQELDCFGIKNKDFPPYLWWCGRIIYVDSILSLSNNEKIYSIIVDRD